MVNFCYIISESCFGEFPMCSYIRYIKTKIFTWPWKNNLCAVDFDPRGTFQSFMLLFGTGFSVINL